MSWTLTDKVVSAAADGTSVPLVAAPVQIYPATLPIFLPPAGVLREIDSATRTAYTASDGGYSFVGLPVTAEQDPTTTQWELRLPNGDRWRGNVPTAGTYTLHDLKLTFSWSLVSATAETLLPVAVQGPAGADGTAVTAVAEFDGTSSSVAVTWPSMVVPFAPLISAPVTFDGEIVNVQAKAITKSGCTVQANKPFVGGVPIGLSKTGAAWLIDLYAQRVLARTPLHAYLLRGATVPDYVVAGATSLGFSGSPTTVPSLYAAAPANSAARFPTVNDFATSSTNTFGSAFTLQYFFRPRAFSAAAQYNGVGSNSVSGATDAGGHIVLYLSTALAFTGPLLTLNTAYMITITWNGVSTFTLYVNGASVGTASAGAQAGSLAVSVTDANMDVEAITIEAGANAPATVAGDYTTSLG